MKSITILQPWATLIAIGEKRFETRGRRINYRGQLAIHAGKRIDRVACEREPIKSTLARHGYTVNNLPTGKVLATCRLTGCWAITGRSNSPLGGMAILFDAVGDRTFRIAQDSNEYHFGDYSIGRLHGN